MSWCKKLLFIKYRAFAKLRLLFVLLLLSVAIIIGLFLLRARQPIHNVLLISIDTCRADYLGCYGFGRKITPNIDTIAQESIVFKNALTPIPLTLPAHSSMLTGTYPPYHKVHDNLNHRLGLHNLTLAEILGGQGYATGAIVSTFVLDKQFGISQGFDSYNDKFEQPIGPRDDKERRGGEASHLACSYLEQHKREPFFLFLHYFDPHVDYEPPEPFATTYANNLYAGEIAYVDHCLAQVIDKLKSLDLYDSTLIIIVGDHGEGLSEHGEAYHGYYVYESMMKVPFIIRPPGYGKPKTVDDVVSLVDVVPTILGYLGIDIPTHVQGKDLSVYSQRKPPSNPGRYVYIESLWPTKYGCNPLIGVVTERWKYIDTTRPELYDLHQRPLEVNNLVEKEAKRARFMQGQLQEMIAELTGAELTDSRLVIDEETRRRFESLGYVGTATVDTTLELDQKKPDPKDLISYHEDSQRVTYLIYHGRFDEAKAICEKMLVEWPDLPDTHLHLGRLTFEKGELAESIAHNSKYLTLVKQPGVQHHESLVFNPNAPTYMAHNLLGGAYYKLEQYDKAVEHYTAILAIQFEHPDAHSNLAGAFFKLGKIDEAVKHWTEALRLKSNWPEVHNNLAAAYYKQGETDKAIAHWTEALRLKPDWTEVRDNLNKLIRRESRDQVIAQYIEMLRNNPGDPDTHDKLAMEYYRQGDIEQAIEHWTEAVRLRPDRAESRNNLATAFYRQGDVEQAIKHWTGAVGLKPDWAEVHNNLAWVLATVEDQKLRNPAISNSPL
ncbi:MAG: sulfatase-like hydrolase/transferase [Planctomycetota bacterium]|jgi:arylsulfatase A-like enzyme/Flp pilus assembly protein TadD